jgi:hypothetical protein
MENAIKSIRYEALKDLKKCQNGKKECHSSTSWEEGD